MTSQAAFANMTRSAANDMAKAAEELGDKIGWSPLEKGRSAVSQMQECILFALIGTEIFKTHQSPMVDGESFAKIAAEYDTPEKALAGLRKVGGDFADAIELLPAEKMHEKLTLNFFGSPMERSYNEIVMMNYWNTVYHEGQVNYIQTLCAPDAPAAA